MFERIGTNTIIIYSHIYSYIFVQLLVCESETLKEVFTTTIRKEEISEVKFSPDGKFLAMGSHDNFIGIPFPNYLNSFYVKTNIFQMCLISVGDTS